jgi:hypothetical protein
MPKDSQAPKPHRTQCERCRRWVRASNLRRHLLACPGPPPAPYVPPAPAELVELQALLGYSHAQMAALVDCHYRRWLAYRAGDARLPRAKLAEIQGEIARKERARKRAKARDGATVRVVGEEG